MNVKDFNFELPQELIAQDPLELNLDFKLIRSPSADTSSMVPLHWSITWKNFSTSEMF